MSIPVTEQPYFPYIALAVAIIVALVIVIIAVRIAQSKRVAEPSAHAKPKQAFSLAWLFRKGISDAFYEELSRALIEADSGVDLTREVVKELKARVEEKRLTDPDAVRKEFRDILEGVFLPSDFSFSGNTILFIVGVNGVGKTTSIAKIANMLKEKHSVILGAADTFRAAAIEQLEMWAERLSLPIVKGQQGGDPASVLFDAVTKARTKAHDLVIIDTAGRFHNKEHLVRQLTKMMSVAREKFSDYRLLPLLVLDANVGQNGFEQAKVFLENCAVEGVMLAKFDATAKGGVAFAVNKYLSLPIMSVGVGEKPENIKRFDKNEFLDNVLGA